LKSKKISFWIEEGFALYSSEPVVKKYYNKNYIIYIYTTSNMKNLVSDYFSGLNINIIIIDNLGPLYLKIVSRLFNMLFINRKFSVMYENDLNKYYGIFYNIINKLFPFKIKNKNINNYYSSVLSFFNKFRFHGDFVIAYTFVSKAYLFANKKTKIILIMESWDHIIKRPHLIKPDIFMTWNNDLKTDAIAHQNYKKIKYIYPSKLRYINDLSKKSNNDIFNTITNIKYRNDLLTIMNKNVILFPVGLTSNDGYKRFLGEIKLIKSLAKMILNTDFIIFVKPKPTGPVGDYDILLNETNIIVGEYSPSANKLDMLKNEYHSYRYLLLKNSTILISLGTTFGLDAAMANIPILHLNLEFEEFKEFAIATKNPHVVKYLSSKDYVVNYTSNDKIIFNSNLIEKCQKYSDNLRNWCLNKDQIDEV
jgi:hypothetical protein